jgi:hypothetical protein
VAEGLVGELSGARVRAELVALLGESAATVAAALRIAERLGLLAAVGPGLEAQPAARLDRLDAARARFGPGIPAWRPRLALIAGGADDGRVAALAARLRLGRADAAAFRAAATAPAVLGPRLAAAAAPSDVAELLDRLPVDAAVLVAAAGGAGADAAELYLERLRGIRLEIDGTVLRDELGLAQSPRVGEVLAELLRRKRNGQLRDRGSELAAARELVGRAAS